jgi:hypothetical protein
MQPRDLKPEQFPEPGAGRGAFLAWFEGHSEAVAIGPGVPRGTVSNTPTDLKQILGWTV